MPLAVSGAVSRRSGHLKCADKMENKEAKGGESRSPSAVAELYSAGEGEETISLPKKQTYPTPLIRPADAMSVAFRAL